MSSVLRHHEVIKVIWALYHGGVSYTEKHYHVHQNIVNPLCKCISPARRAPWSPYKALWAPYKALWSPYKELWAPYKALSAPNRALWTLYCVIWALQWAVYVIYRVLCKHEPCTWRYYICVLHCDFAIENQGLYVPSLDVIHTMFELCIKSCMWNTVAFWQGNMSLLQRNLFKHNLWVDTIAQKICLQALRWKLVSYS